MKFFTLALMFCLFVSTQVEGQTNLYENPDFAEIAKSHKVIAVMPFKTQVKLRPKQMKKMTSDDLYNLERSEGEGIQSAMHSWFLKRKKRGKLQALDVMSPQRTNALLAKQDIDYDNIYDYTAEELAAILEVDAVIMGDYETDKPMSDGASIALGLLIGFWGSTNTAVVNMNVFNAGDGVLLWNYNKKVRGSLGSSPDDLINTLMRKASRRLAYTKRS